MKKTKIVSLPDFSLQVRNKLIEEHEPNDDPGTSKSESGLKLNLVGKGIGLTNGLSHYDIDDDDDDEDQDFGDEEMDIFDDSAVQSAAAIMDRGEKKLYNKLRTNDEWSAKVVSTPNIWHKD